MKKLLVLAVSLSFMQISIAEELRATKSDAEAMVKKGVSALKSGDKEKVYSDISAKNGPYTTRDLYLVVYRMDGTVLAHGANTKMVGKNLIDLKDIDGKAFVKERIELAAKNASFWQRYKFVNPETKKIEPKQMYCERLEETIVCGGIYE
ncbi:cache domain-containing protein [Undibacterium luofuense]|uniref:cache domain-containing protein n=1 Tax=Undibacterium luofuense TaxID=2828733 RepID=UPI0030EF3672